MILRGAGSNGAAIIDGRAMAAEMLSETRAEIARLEESTGAVPGIRVVMVGRDQASGVYARRILKTAESVGAVGQIVTLDESVEERIFRDTMRALSEDPAVTGVILQLPLPRGLPLAAFIDEMDPRKDLDGIHPVNAGLISRGEGGVAPSCAEAALEMLRRSGVSLAGRPTVVVGRSNVVGTPLQLLLMHQDATVTVCHRQTRDLAGELRRAEVVVVAAGAPGLVRGEAIRPGAVVIDCGISVLDDGTIAGDVDLPSVAPVAGAVSPVPGGVGPVTNAVLMSHLTRAAASLAATSESVSSS